MGEVERDLDIVVAEAGILRGIEHLQQGRRGIALVVAAELVDLVEQQQGVFALGLDEGRHDAAGHGANISLAMPPNVRLVPHAAQADAVELSVHGLGHGNGDGGLTHPRRPH